MFSRLVRSIGMCESGRLDHAGPLQCAHGFSRRYRAVRWDRRNAWCLCAGCHMFFTHHPIEWDEWMHRQMGDALYSQIRSLALGGERVDLKELHALLKEQTKELAA